MTAVVAILNKTGMALAADSAATITNGNTETSKVFNTANKVFNLSKYHPIAIMVYSNSEFLSTPWELIIKLYRNELDKTSFGTVKEYWENFNKFLLKNPLFKFCEKEDDFLERISNHLTLELLNQLREELLSENDYQTLINLNNLESFNSLDISEKQTVISKITAILSSKISEHCKVIDNNFKKLDSLASIDKTMYKQQNKAIIYKAFSETTNEIAQLINQENLIDGLIDSFENLVINFLQSDNFFFGSTGLVFAGYGNNEIYPSLYAVEIDGVVHKLTRFRVNSDVQITDENSQELVPFAQTDVMNTFITGFNNDIQNVIKSSLLKALNVTLDTYNKVIEDLSENNIDAAALSFMKHKVTEDIVTTLDNDIKSIIYNSQIFPTLQALKFLSKEDLAELAESLIYLTFLKRRTTSSLESVGGAIDVAIITKGDGFIWKKRKHYFDKELNQQFFHNYYGC